jgi:hypothetical protein
MTLYLITEHCDTGVAFSDPYGKQREAFKSKRFHIAGQLSDCRQTDHFGLADENSLRVSGNTNEEFHSYDIVQNKKC